jgi:EAL domain-containing protein (putative c-di-GMP-specific phosphodiesterase class I)
MEECGLIGDLDREIARQARGFRRSLVGIAPRDFRIYVNVSATGRPLDQVIAAYTAAADDDDTDLSMMGLEITERAIISDPSAASETLAVARSRGLAVVLDDVGTGYSSLSLIRALPLDGLKIDASFVQGMERDAADAAVVASVAALGRRLHLRVTGEGVETEGQLSALTAEKVGNAQGFLFSPAVPIDTFTGWLRDGPPWIEGRPVTSISLVR